MAGSVRPGGEMTVSMRERTGRFLRDILPYTLCFLIVCALTYGPFALFGRTLIKEGNDGHLIQYPMLVKLHYILGDIIHGRGFAFWSPDIGLGADTIGTLSKYLGSPFAYVAALFPVKYIDAGFTISCILRLYTAGLIVFSFLRYKGHDRMLSTLSGVSYAFSYFAVGSALHDIFLDPLMFFPLLIFGIEKIWRERKPLLLTIATFFSVATYPYFAYMSAIFCGIYVVIRLLFSEREEKAEKGGTLRVLLLMVFAVVLAVMLAAPLLIPALYTLVHASTSSASSPSMLPSLAEVLRVLPSLVTDTATFEHYSYTGAGAFMAAFLPLLPAGLKDRRKRVPLIAFLFSFAALCVPLWGSLMNAFSYRIGRWCYVLAFFLVWSAAEILEGRADLTEREKRVCLTWAGLLAVLTLICRPVLQIIQPVNMFAGLWNCLLIAVFVLDYRRLRASKRALYLLVSCSLGIVYLMVYMPGGGNVLSSYDQAGGPYEGYRTSVLRAFGRLDQEDYYRTDFIEHITANGGEFVYAGTPANEGIFWKARSLSAYTSMSDEGINRFNTALANATMQRRTVSYSNDNRSRLNFLMGVRYFLYESAWRPQIYGAYAGYGYEDAGEALGVSYKESTIPVGIGYVYDSFVSEEEFEELAPLEREQSLMQHAVLPEDAAEDAGDALHAGDGDTVSDTRELTWAYAEDSQVKPDENGDFTAEEDQTMTITVSGAENSELYLCLEGLTKQDFSKEELLERTLGKNSADPFSRYAFLTGQLDYEPVRSFGLLISAGQITKRIYNTEDEPTGISGMTDWTSHLGYHESFEGDIVITFRTAGHYHLDGLKCFAVSSEHFDEQAQKLSSQRLRVTNKSGNTLEGEVHADQGGILYLSLPYTPGWKIDIDGERADTFETNLCFTGALIGEGDHTVRLVYRPAGWRISLCLCAAGLLALAAYGIITRRKKGKTN